MSARATLMTALATLQALDTGYTDDTTTRQFVARVNTIALANDWPFECDNASLPLWYNYKTASALLDAPAAKDSPLQSCMLQRTGTPAFSPRLIARSGKSVKTALQWRLAMFRDMLRPLRADVAALYATDSHAATSGSGAGIP